MISSSLIASLVLSVLPSLLMIRQAECWPLGSPEMMPEEVDPRPFALLRELEQRQIVLKEQQAYNEHLANVLYALAYKNASGEQPPDGDDIVDHRLLYRASRSHGKPTFIRFGKRAAPAFIRFGRSAEPPKQQQDLSAAAKA